MCFPAPLRPAPDLSPTPWSGHPLGGLMTQPTEVAAAPGAVQSPSRRDRLRAATIEEIIQTARQLLVKDGPEAASLRAIAREMGTTAPRPLPGAGRGPPPAHGAPGPPPGSGARPGGEPDGKVGRPLPRVPPLGA